MATSDAFKDELTCSVCLEFYREPHQLKCLHTFCLQCLTDLKRNNMIQCPECREKTTFHNIKRDFKTASLVEIYTQESQMTRESSVEGATAGKCEVCDDGEKVVSKCMDCEQFMCGACTKAHKGAKVSRSHQVHSVGHIVQSLQRNFRDKQKEVDKLQAKIDEKCHKIVQAMRDIEESQTKQLQELNQYKADMIHQIEKHQREMEKTVKSTNGHMLESLRRSKDLCDQLKRQLKSTQTFLLDMSKCDDVGTLYDTVHNLDSDVNSQIEELKNKLGNIDMSAKSNVIVHKESSFNPGSYFSVNVENRKVISKLAFTNLCDKKIEKIKSVEMSGRYVSQKLQLIDDNLWSAHHDDGIKVYSQECDLIKTITDDKMSRCSGVTKAHTGDIIVACSDGVGLHQLSPTGSYIGCIEEGSFSDICTYGECLYALDYWNCNIVFFVKNQQKWLPVTKLHLRNNNCGSKDKLSIGSAGICVTLWENNILYLYNLEGKLLYKTGGPGTGEAGLFNHISLCCVDHVGNVLVTDSDNQRLQVYDSNRKCWRVLTHASQELGEPRAAIIDPDVKFLWVATSEGNMIKYAIAST